MSDEEADSPLNNYLWDFSMPELRKGYQSERDRRDDQILILLAQLHKSFSTMARFEPLSQAWEKARASASMLLRFLTQERSDLHPRLTQDLRWTLSEANVSALRDDLQAGEPTDGRSVLFLALAMINMSFRTGVEPGASALKDTLDQLAELKSRTSDWITEETAMKGLADAGLLVGAEGAPITFRDEDADTLLTADVGFASRVMHDVFMALGPPPTSSRVSAGGSRPSAPLSDG